MSVVVTRSQLDARARHRPPGYIQSVLAIAAYLGDGRYSLTQAQWETLRVRWSPAVQSSPTLTSLALAIETLPETPARAAVETLQRLTQEVLLRSPHQSPCWRARQLRRVDQAIRVVRAELPSVAAVRACPLLARRWAKIPSRGLPSSNPTPPSALRAPIPLPPDP